MSEWLGNGLQNRPHQFESGWNLKKKTCQYGKSFFVFVYQIGLLCLVADTGAWVLGNI